MCVFFYFLIGVLLWTGNKFYKKESSDKSVPFKVWFSIHECSAGTIEFFHMAFPVIPDSFCWGLTHSLTHTTHTAASQGLFA